jgi:hypothetical protein
MMPKLFCRLLGCDIRVHVWHRIKGLREETTDRYEQMLSDMHPGGRVRAPRDDFSRTVVAKIGCKGIVKGREIGQHQLTGT